MSLSLRCTKMFTMFVAVVALAALTVASAQADLLAGWDFGSLPGGSGSWGPSPMTASSSATGLTVGGLTRGWTPGSGSAAAGAWGGNGFNTVTPSEASAIAAGNFATFTFAAQEGYALSISDIAAYNVRRSSTGPTTGIWQYQVGNSEFTDIGSAITWGSNTSSTGNPQSTVLLSSIPVLQDIDAGTTVTLRCVTWGASGGTGTWYFNDPEKDVGVNDLVVDGTLNAASTPEPGMFTLLTAAGATALAVSCWRRRRCS